MPAKFVKKATFAKINAYKNLKKVIKKMAKFLFAKIDVVKVLSKYENDCQLKKLVTIVRNLK